LERSRRRRAGRFFTKDGIFSSPDTTPGINGEALATFVRGVWEAISDISFELLNAGEIEPGVVAHHWRIRGTSARERNSRLKERPLFAWKEIRFARTKTILTGRRWNIRAFYGNLRLGDWAAASGMASHQLAVCSVT
jgi:hypothetical protein